jgi:hypothetical protein
MRPVKTLKKCQLNVALTRKCSRHVTNLRHRQVSSARPRTGQMSASVHTAGRVEGHDLQVTGGNVREL